jgi:hypothetical protein
MKQPPEFRNIRIYYLREPPTAEQVAQFELRVPAPPPGDQEAIRRWERKQPRGKPIATVALGVTSDGCVCRGISMCSTGRPERHQPADHWCKRTGRKWATKRCHRAMGTRDSSDPIGETTREGWPVAPIVQRFIELFSAEYGADFCAYKSVFNATPTERERRILERATEPADG